MMKTIIEITPNSDSTPIPIPSHATVSITLDGTIFEITSLDIIIDNSIDAKPGVIGLYDENNVLLNVYQTNNIAAKWKRKRFSSGADYTRMCNDGVDFNKVTYKVITFESDLKTRNKIKQAFASKYNAKYSCTLISNSNISNIFTCVICNIKYAYHGKKLLRYTKRGIYICPACREALPGIGNYISRCTKCNCYFKGNSSSASLCPKCHIVSCESCGKEFLLDYVRSDYNIFLCPECKSNASGSGNFYRICMDCHKPFKCVGPRTFRCNSCQQIYSILTCCYCSCEFKGSNKQLEVKGRPDMLFLCKKCEELLNKTFPDKRNVVRCKSCHQIIKVSSQFEMCPLCNQPAYPKTNICEQCGIEFEYTHQLGVLPFQRCLCPSCREQNKKDKSVLEYEDLLKQGWLIGENRQYIYKPQLSELDIKEERQRKQYGDTNCKRCGRLFHKWSPTQVNCHFCHSISQCSWCHYWYVQHDKRVRFCGVKCAGAATYSDRFANGGSLNTYVPFTITHDNDVVNIDTIITNAKTITSDNCGDFCFPGVWCKIFNGIIIDLMATSNIDKEFNQVKKKLANPSNGKYRFITSIINATDIEFKVLMRCDNYQRALDYELYLANKLHPKLWKPSPQQQHLWKQMQEKQKQGEEFSNGSS